MKKQSNILLSCCTALLLILSLAACQNGKTPKLESNAVSDEEIVPYYYEKPSPRELTDSEIVELTKAYNADLDALFTVYQNLFTEEALHRLIDKERETPDLIAYDNDPEAYMQTIRGHISDVIPFRAEGSLAGPVAPCTFDDAWDMICNEFSKYITKDSPYKTQFEPMRAHYEEHPQESFDAMRRIIWDDFNCVYPDDYPVHHYHYTADDPNSPIS